MKPFPHVQIAFSSARSALALGATVFLGCLALNAATFTTVNLSSYVNGSVRNNPQSYPIGLTSGNQNTGILFDIAALNGISAGWSNAQSVMPILDVPIQVSGQASFYALLNNTFGTPGINEYDITLEASNGDRITYPSIGGVDTRDYNQDINTNSTVAPTTHAWFDNGVGQRLDVREFNLPTSFRTQVISHFIITPTQNRDAVLFAGLTFSDVSTNPTPEPSSLLLSGTAGCVFAFLLRNRKRLGSGTAGKSSFSPTGRSEVNV